MVSFARVEQGEVRKKVAGGIDGVLYAVIDVAIRGVRRILSARPASRRERQAWSE